MSTEGFTDAERQRVQHIAANWPVTVVKLVEAEVLPAYTQRIRDTIADGMDRFAEEAYGEHLFQRPTKEDYAAINDLLKRERGHQLDCVSADVMSRAIKGRAQALRDAAAGPTPTEE